MRDIKVNLRYLLVLVGAVIFTWIIHEFAHWATSEYLGYETIMRLNGTSPIKDENPPDRHKMFISASGPIVTLLQGLFAFLAISRNWNKYLYAFLFPAFYMRLLAGLMNFVNLNDEGRIGVYLEIGTFTLPLLVTGLLFLMVYKTSRRFHLNTKFHLWTIFVTMFTSSVLILSDQFLGIRIL